MVRVRRLDVRAAQLGAVEKVQLFEAIARMRSKAAALVRSGSALSLTDMAKQFGAEGGFKGLGGGQEGEEDTLRRLVHQREVQRQPLKLAVLVLLGAGLRARRP